MQADSVLQFLLTVHFIEKLKLDLLNFNQTLPLAGEEMVEFLMQLTNFKFSLEIYLVVMGGAQTVFRFNPVLAHHDNRRLNRCETGKNEILIDSARNAMTIKVKGELNLEADGEVNIKGRNVTIDGGPKVNVKGGTVNLN